MKETGCECSLVGYCTRHKAIKDDRQLKLCQTSQDHFDLWENAKTLKTRSEDASSEKVKEAGRKAWTALHSMQDPTEEKIHRWIFMVPAYNCQCRKFARQYISENPPDLKDQDSFFIWTWKFHDQVDKKTGDERVSLQEAREIWGIGA